MTRNGSRIIDMTNGDRENYRTGPNSMFRQVKRVKNINIGPTSLEISPNEVFVYFSIFVGGLGVREWSKNAIWTRTIIFPAPICQIDYSRAISGHFLTFWAPHFL